MTKPLIFITAGDPLGIGPEITVKALRSAQVRRACRPVVLGELDSLFRAGFSEKLAPLLALDACEPLPTEARPCAEAGRVSFQAVKLGVKLALQCKGRLVTAPISKQSWTLAGVPFTGHTELLRSLCKSEGLMAFTSGLLCCGLVTEHFALKDVSSVLTKKRITTAARLLYRMLREKGIRQPRIGVCALNPHAGDNGKFGTEEKRVIAPAIQELKQEKIVLEGPLPSDSAWQAHVHGKYDGLLCMYHDQALSPLKMAAREPIIHVTAGLPLVRTSPTHGTAFDIAGRGQADPSGMIAAILWAAKQ